MLMVPEDRSCERLARNDSAPGLRGRFTVHPGTDEQQPRRLPSPRSPFAL